MDAAIHASPQALVCDKGCSNCRRQFDVVALPVEVFEIHAHVLRHFKPDALRSTIQRVSGYVAKRKGVSEETRLSLREACPFLVDKQLLPSTRCAPLFAATTTRPTPTTAKSP